MRDALSGSFRNEVANLAGDGAILALCLTLNELSERRIKRNAQLPLSHVLHVSKINDVHGFLMRGDV